jgi:hypothetical protein
VAIAKEVIDATCKEESYAVEVSRDREGKRVRKVVKAACCVDSRKRRDAVIERSEMYSLWNIRRSRWTR